MRLMMWTSNRIPKTYPSDEEEEEYAMQTDVVKYTITRDQIDSLPDKTKKYLVANLQLAVICSALGNNPLVRLCWGQAASILGVPDDIDLMKDAYETPEGNLVIEVFASPEEAQSQC